MSALAYLSSDVYRSASDYLATFSERGLQLDILGGWRHVVNVVIKVICSSFTKRRIADHFMMFYKVIVYRISYFI